MKNKISLITLIALLLGVIFGLVLKENILKIEFLGTIYVSALKYLILPVIFTSIVSSIYESSKNKGKLVFKTICLFIILFTTSFLLASLIVYIIDPAKGFDLIVNKADVETTKINVLDLFMNLLPKDILGIFTGKYLFFIIIISFVMGYLSYLLKLESFIKGINFIKKYLFIVLEWLTYYAPIAVFSLIGVSIYRFGLNTILAGIKYIMTAYVAGIFVLVIVMLVPLKIFKGINIKTFIKKIYSIWLTTVSTCSSAATLPYSLKLCKDELKLDEEITDIVVPLGTTIHMCGGAVSFALLGLFSAKLFGLEINLHLYLMMLISSLLINMSAPGIPGGGIVVGATYLQGLGIPLDFIGLYSGIYKILDMLYTTLNVTGDIIANVLLNEKRIIE